MNEVYHNSDNFHENSENNKFKITDLVKFHQRLRFSAIELNTTKGAKVLLIPRKWTIFWQG